MILLLVSGGTGGGPGGIQGVNGPAGVGGGLLFGPTDALNYMGGSGLFGNGTISGGTGGTLVSYTNPPIGGTSEGGNGAAGGSFPLNFGSPGMPGRAGFAIIHWW
ncbi:MAG: hypothetical protein HOP29_18905 [Phycisphaerales bacterium]|nr:hypothetical protein [Phycisphaerales bacterium]